MKKPNMRVKVLIYPSFQLNFLAHSVGSALVTMLIFFLGNRIFFRKFIRDGRELGLTEDHVFFRFLQAQQHSLDLVYGLSALVALVFLTVYGLYLSHRVVGPLIRLQGHLRKLDPGGKPTPLQFRQGDYFKEIAQTMNEHLERLWNRKPPDA